MRLITKKLWRAFPELDPFDDAQCQSFVRAAGGAPGHRALRWGAMALTCILGVCLLPMVVAIENYAARQGWLSARYLEALLSRPRWMADIVHLLLVLVMPLALGALAALVTRDVLLRWRVRRVVTLRGRCARCRYFLGGLPVGSDLKVICPECGFEMQVDASMGELQRDADGASRFVHSSAIAPTRHAMR